MTSSKTKAGKALGGIADLTVRELDQYLVALCHDWTIAYVTRQAKATFEGDTTPPPAPPRIPSEVPSAPAASEIKRRPSQDGPVTVADLIKSYTEDKDSPYHALRYKTRDYYYHQLKRIQKAYGSLKLADLTADAIENIYETRAAEGTPSMGYALVNILRILINYGATALQHPECERLAGAVKRVKKRSYSPRKVYISAAQADAIRAEAHRQGKHSIALAQALQFDCKLRQKDVVGEWVPIGEPGSSERLREIKNGGTEKWLKGLRWSQIDEDLILTHYTSLNQKKLVIDLKTKPMVRDELRRLGSIPTSGPMIINEKTGDPWVANEFRRFWRKIAKACGIPDDVNNADTTMSNDKMASETDASEAM
jgi:hypothetical protein